MGARLLLAFLSLAMAHAFAQAALNTFTDKAAFLAATGATNATGPLPNLGLAGNPTIGSLSFAANSGANTLYIGASGTIASPDWYPPVPRNEIALTQEELAVFPATPVFSLGFDFIEPKTTVQPWGATPVNSTYKVTLYHQATLVGEFTFDAPDDVLAFVGVHSSQAFSFVAISDNQVTKQGGTHHANVDDCNKTM